ncbi:MAG: hypothetical protein HUU54_07800 [Ignavibacteriaceae bacterium]|nr:hypothetical protein [Ignavibacteriaceae bacterium]
MRFILKFIRVKFPAFESFRHAVYTLPFAIYGWLRLRYPGVNGKLRIVPGASGIFQRGWIPLEYPYFNILNEDSWHYWMAGKKADAILMEHVLEHFTASEAKVIFKHCKSNLARDGYIRIAVPDGKHPSLDYIAMVEPGGTGLGSETHRVLYNYKQLRSLLEENGYRVKLLEYYDDEGNFNTADWVLSDGCINRSSKGKNRMRKNFNYTSLIIDAFINHIT